MRLKVFLMSMALALMSQVSHAGWVSSATGSSLLQGAFSGSVLTYAVFDTEAGTDTAGIEALGLTFPSDVESYVYLYQVSPGNVGMRTVAFGDVQGVSQAGQLKDYRLSGFPSESLSPSSPTKNPLSTDLSALPEALTYTFSAATKRSSPVMYFVSRYGPNAFGEVTVGLDVSGNAYATAGVVLPQAIPVPPALALIGLGLPFMGMLKKRKKS